jgi:Sec-independent protein translocase protein TatA
VFLDPVKLLVIAVVALVVLGPERLPKVARTVGSFWHDFSRWRATIDEQVKSAFPDLPSTRDIASTVRSPLAFLDRLAQESGASAGLDSTPSKVAAEPVTVNPVPSNVAEPVDPWDSWPTDTAGRPAASTGPGPTDTGALADVVSMN